MHVEDDRDKLWGYRELIRALTEASGGERELNRRFVKWLDLDRAGDVQPDYRRRFRIGRRVEAKTAFRQGRFFGESYPWCCGPAFLYAANKFNEYVTVLAGMFASNVPLIDLCRIVAYTPDAVRCFPIDLEPIRVRKPNGKIKLIRIGSTLMRNCVDPRALLARFSPDTLRLSENVMWDQSALLTRMLRIRRTARRKLYLGESATSAAAAAFYEPVAPTDPVFQNNWELERALMIASAPRASPSSKRSGVQDSLAEWLRRHAIGEHDEAMLLTMLSRVTRVR